jgi:dTDP-4-amino-4,6-dideoxygalactose transaminase
MSAAPKPGRPAPERPMNVPLLDLKAQYQSLKAEILPVMAEVCEGQGFILGPYVTQLEQRVAEYSQSKFGIGVSSGTDALLLALMALDIGPGDAVVTSPYTFFATGGTIARAGARPIFVDVDPTSYNLCPRATARFIAESCDAKGDAVIHRASGARVKAIMPVHLYGQCADLDPFLEVTRRHGLRLIEDAAQAIGSELPGGRRAGGLGDVGCFSFFPSKNLGAFGDAGLCTAQDDELAERLRVMRVHGGKPKYFHSVIGGNFRIDELQAAVLCVKLHRLDAWTLARQRNAAQYDALFSTSGLGAQLATPRAIPGYRHIYNQYVVRVRERDALKDYLTACGVGTEIYYPVPLHLQGCFAYLGQLEGECPESERAARETLALPVYPELATEQLHYVVDCIRRFYG